MAIDSTRNADYQEASIARWGGAEAAKAIATCPVGHRVWEASHEMGWADTHEDIWDWLAVPEGTVPEAEYTHDDDRRIPAYAEIKAWVWDRDTERWVYPNRAVHTGEGHQFYEGEVRGW